MPRRKPTAEQLDARIWSRTSVRAPDECWEWQSYCDGSGYASIHMDGRHRRATRVIWEMRVGPLSSNQILLHSCDNPLCVNVAHLRIGTQRENLEDMANKGRAWWQGQTHCNRGHLYDEGNTRLYGPHRRYRACHKCDVIRQQNRQQKLIASERETPICL